MKRILYRLTTDGLGDFYLIATDPTTAQVFLEEELNNELYGSSDQRKVVKIEVIAKEIGYFPEGKRFFSSKDKLLFTP